MIELWYNLVMLLIRILRESEEDGDSNEILIDSFWDSIRMLQEASKSLHRILIGLE